MSNRKIVVFDLDDTLYKEVDFLLSGFRCISDYLNRDFHVENSFEFMLQQYTDQQNVFQNLIAYYQLNVSLEELILIYRNHLPDIKLDQSTLWYLKVALELGTELGIITDGRKITQKNKIKALRLDNYIPEENIVISESFGSEKPAEANYLYFVEKFGKADYFYIGDNVNKDFITPNRLNWTSICLLDDGRNIHKQEFSKDICFLPQHRISKINELYSFLE